MAPRGKRNVKRNLKRRNYRKNTKQGAQKRFMLQKPTRRQVSNISNMAECVKFVGWENYPDQKTLPIQEFYVSTTASSHFIPIHPFWYMRAKRDIPELNSAVEGRDIFSKYLQTKLEIKYPESMFGPQGGTRPIEVIYGWVNPLNLTDRTTPSENQVTFQEILDYVKDMIAEDFDSKNDTMEFKDRRKRNYNIVGRFKVKPNQNSFLPGPVTSSSSSGGVADTMGFEGSAPPLRRNINWKMMKKVRYERSVNGGSPPNDPFIYPNQAYLPFICLYNPDHANYSPNSPDGEGNLQVKQIKIRYSSCHWFNDF